METLEQKWETKIQAVVHQLEYEGSDRVIYFRVIYAVKYITKVVWPKLTQSQGSMKGGWGVWVYHILLFFGLSNPESN